MDFTKSEEVPVACMNPILAIVVGNGFEANGNTLGRPLTTAPRGDRVRQGVR